VSGHATTYQLTKPYYQNTTEVYVNGLRWRLGDDYTESNPAAGQITFSAPLDTETQSLRICYIAA
jgi:hypothetical protein